MLRSHTLIVPNLLVSNHDLKIEYHFILLTRIKLYYLLIYLFTIKFSANNLKGVAPKGNIKVKRGITNCWG